MARGDGVYPDRLGKSPYVDLIDLCPSIQTRVDWDKVAASGVKGVIIQSSRYSSTPELAYDKYAAAASSAGLAVGAYHFGACDSDPTAQAEFFLRRMANYGLRPGDIPPMMDLEYAKETLPKKGAAYIRQWGNTFLARLRKEMAYLHLPNVPGWYTFSYFGTSIGPIDGLMSESPFWFARYRSTTAPTAAWYPPDDWEPNMLPKGCPRPILVQYSGTAGYLTPGINQDCDRNIFRGSLEEWDAFRGLPGPEPEPVPTGPVHTSTYQTTDVVARRPERPST